MISNQSRGLSKGPGRMRLRAREYAVAAFADARSYALSLLSELRFRRDLSPQAAEFAREAARRAGSNARDWFKNWQEIESEVAV